MAGWLAGARDPSSRFPRARRADGDGKDGGDAARAGRQSRAPTHPETSDERDQGVGDVEKYGVDRADGG